MWRLTVFVLALAFARESVALEAEEPPKPKITVKKKPPPVDDLDLDLDLEFDLELPEPASAAPDVQVPVAKPREPEPAPAPVPKEPFVPIPPPVHEEPLPLVVVIDSPPPPTAPSLLAPPPPASDWALTGGVILGGSARALTDVNGAGLADGGSLLVGLTARVQYTEWILQFDWRGVTEDRQLVAGVHSESGVEYAGRLSYLAWQSIDGLSAAIGFAVRRRSHTGSPQAAWWAAHDIDPHEIDFALVPAVEWQVDKYLSLTAALLLGYGWGSVNNRPFRNYSGPFADVEVGFLVRKTL